MATVTTISLPADVSAYIQAELNAGKYQTAEELVAAALRERRDREQHLSELRAKIDEGLADFEKGNYIEIRNEEEHHAFFDSIKRRGLERLNRERRNAGKPPLPDDPTGGNGSA
jgi:putative addiction module CopG family antidote